MSHQDIITYEEKAVMIFDSAYFQEFFENPRYEPIFVALRKGPMTVKDLETEYNALIEKKVDSLDLELKEKNALKIKMRRKAKTLYKYLDILSKKELITEAGKRITKGQTAAETLYGRVAKLFLLRDKAFNKVTKEDLLKAAPILAKVIEIEHDVKITDLDCLTEVISKIAYDLKDTITEIFTKHIDEITESTGKSNYDDIMLTMRSLEIILTIFKSKKYEKELAKCFR